eukprot:726695-Amphidinium_carterae.1
MSAQKSSLPFTLTTRTLPNVPVPTVDRKSKSCQEELAIRTQTIAKHEVANSDVFWTQRTRLMIWNGNYEPESDIRYFRFNGNCRTETMTCDD